jgi:hypothetical protein
MVELDARNLGTLELDGGWVPYMDLNGESFLPRKVTVANNEYLFDRSFTIFGHSATMPQAIRDLRAQGKRPLIIEREDRYCVFVTSAA